MDPTILSIIAATVPTGAISLIAWGFRQVFADMRGRLAEVQGGLKEIFQLVQVLNEKVGGHGEKLAALDARISSLEGMRRRSR